MNRDPRKTKPRHKKCHTGAGKVLGEKMPRLENNKIRRRGQRRNRKDLAVTPSGRKKNSRPEKPEGNGSNSREGSIG